MKKDLKENAQVEPQEIIPDRKKIIEALLFASHKPISAQKIAAIIGSDVLPKDIKAIILELQEEYRNEQRAFEIIEIAGGFRIFTRPSFHPWVSKLQTKKDDGSLSAAALQILTIIAYRQPVTRAEIENIRGVGCGQIIKNLSERGLVKSVGRSEKIGAPLLYGTTKKFLEIFGLSSLKDLPHVEGKRASDSILARDKSKKKAKVVKEDFQKKLINDDEPEADQNIEEDSIQEKEETVSEVADDTVENIDEHSKVNNKSSEVVEETLEQDEKDNT